MLMELQLMGKTPGHSMTYVLPHITYHHFQSFFLRDCSCASGIDQVVHYALLP